MGKELTNSNEVTAIQQMSSNVNVGLDEVVSVFVSRYETQLFDRKDELGKNIKTIKSELEDLDKRLIGSIDTNPYGITIAVLNITSVVDKVGVEWGKKPEDNRVTIHIDVKDNDKSDRYSHSFSKRVTFPTSSKDVKIHDKLNDDLENLKTDLAEVMGLIKSVSRKERQVRGRISEMKLKESGFAGLLDSPELTKLVEL